MNIRMLVAAADQLNCHLGHLCARDVGDINSYNPIGADTRVWSVQLRLAPGTNWGRFEVLEFIGAGGMGEVYRARDTRLARHVALKVLPADVAADPRRMARLNGEAKVLASLDHPNIASIHGLEECNGNFALIMELVEGPTLADLMAAGRIPLGEALRVARQVAEALEHAHEKGTIHRDLKPANIKVRPDGRVKVIDFGLAKALADAVTNGTEAVSGDRARSLHTEPTLAGAVIGTAAYMSPEQALGRPLDRRADIWSFGVVLYEMLTARRAFPGETTLLQLARVVDREPDLAAFPPETPAPVQDLVRRCLIKDPVRRLQAIGDARVVIDEALSITEWPQSEAQDRRRRAARLSEVLAWLLVGVLGVTLVALLLVRWRTVPQAKPSVRLSTDLGVEGTELIELGPAAVISPDGATLAFAAQAGEAEEAMLYVRPLGQLRASALPGTAGAFGPVFSADGREIAFFAAGMLKRVSVNGGSVATVCKAPNGRGASWAPDGTIVFASNTQGSLSRVKSAGGQPTPVTKLDLNAGEATHRWPQVLPGGNSVLFTASRSTGSFDDTNIAVQSLTGSDRKVLLRGGYHAQYLGSGHIVYLHLGTLLAVPFDPDHLETTGPARPVLDRLATTENNGGAQFAFSDGGTFIYASGAGSARGKASISWIQPNGKPAPLLQEADFYSSLRFAPNGLYLAFVLWDGEQHDLYVWDWRNKAKSRRTFDAADEESPVWTPDSSRIAFSSDRENRSVPNVYWMRADGAGEIQRLTSSGNWQQPTSWHPNRNLMLLTEMNPQTGMDVLALPLTRDGNGWVPGKPFPVLNSGASEANAVFSPNGRWLAYESNAGSTFEVYVQAFPGPGGPWQVSVDGGHAPAWSATGRELFYRSGDQRIMVAPCSTTGASFSSGPPRLWSPEHLAQRGRTRNFDVHPDGRRIAALTQADLLEPPRRDRLVFVLNFFDELRRLAPSRQTP